MKQVTIGWIATSISIIGIILNAWKIVWCWPVWFTSNCFLIYLAVKRKDTPQTILWIVFQIFNIYGWYCWLK